MLGVESLDDDALATAEELGEGSTDTVTEGDVDDDSVVDSVPDKLSDADAEPTDDPLFKYDSVGADDALNVATTDTDGVVDGDPDKLSDALEELHGDAL